MSNGRPPSDPVSSDQTSTVPAAAPVAGSAAQNEVGRQIGPYKLLGLLGEGGFGVVYLAEQQEPVRRRVALKIIKPGMDTRQVIARFEAERQALALMDHPNVARVFDAGATEHGRPYFAMEHVPGVPMTEHCDRHKLSIAQRLDLFMHVCEAVQHAHQKGIIHRDIKPTNILVAIKDVAAGAGANVAAGLRAGRRAPADRETPGSAVGVPKVIDFGVAKALSQRLTERTIFTEQGQLIGTPEYMSPEQAEMTAQDIDTRSDIYSLGVLLYELLTGTLPFDRESLRRAALAEIQRVIREVEPPKPSTKVSSLQSEPRPSESGRAEPESQARVDRALERESLAGASGSVAEIARNRRSDPPTLTRLLRGDLDWITMKTLEKDRTRRYATASDLAADIRRHLRHEPVVAGPPSAAYRFRKFVRRNQALVTGAAAVFAALVLGIFGTSWGLVQALSARQAEAEQRKLAEENEQKAKDNEALALKRAGQTRQVAEFQQSMLSKINAREMGQGIIDDLRGQIREGMTREGASPDEIEAALASFEQLAARVNATNVALNVVDEHVLARAAETIREEFADQPTIRPLLQQTVAGVYREIGLYQLSMPLLETALKTRREQLGDDHPDTLSSINSMGALLHKMGKYEEAMPYYREALEGRRRVLGHDHPDTLNSINNTGAMLWAMGRLGEALPYWHEALEGYRSVLGNDHPDTLNSINNMGALLLTMGKHEEAEPYFREVLEHKRRVLGDEDRDTMTAISNMGALLYTMGRFNDAEPFFREVLERKRRVLGDDHPDTLLSIANMGALLGRMGRHKEAEPYCREALERNRRVLGDDHPNTIDSMNNVGVLLSAMERYDEAESYCREALERSRRTLGNDDLRTLRLINNMGTLFDDMGQFGEAERHYREALEGRRRALGDDHPDTLISLHNRAELLIATGRFREAQLLALESHDRHVSRYGVEHAKTADAINLLVILYTAWHEAEPDKGYDAKAAEWRAKLDEEGTEARRHEGTKGEDPAGAQPASRPASQPAAPPTPPAPPADE